MNLEKFKLILRKLGILRSGSYSWKGNAKDRPIEAIMDDVYDGEKDLINKQDLVKSKSMLKNSWAKISGKTYKKEQKKADERELPALVIRKTLHIVSLVCGGFFVCIFVVNSYFGFWLWVNGLFWFLFTRHTKNFRDGVSYSLGKLVSILIVAIFISFLTMGFTAPSQEEGIQYSTIMNPLDMVDLGMDLEDEFSLGNVRVSEVAGKVLEVRIQTPEGISPEAISLASSYIMGYLDEQIPEKIGKERIILTVNHMDAVVLEANREDIGQWKNEKITDQEFIGKMKVRNLMFKNTHDRPEQAKTQFQSGGSSGKTAKKDPGLSENSSPASIWDSWENPEADSGQ